MGDIAYETMEDYRARIRELEEENRKLKEKLSEVTMVSDDEKQSIEHILELEKDNKELKDKVFFRDNRISWFEGEEERLNEEINKLKEENKKLKNSIEYRKKKAEANQEKANQIDKIMNLPGVMVDGKIDWSKVAVYYMM